MTAQSVQFSPGAKFLYKGTFSLTPFKVWDGNKGYVGFPQIQIPKGSELTFLRRHDMGAIPCYIFNVTINGRTREVAFKVETVNAQVRYGNITNVQELT